MASNGVETSHWVSVSESSSSAVIPRLSTTSSSFSPMSTMRSKRRRSSLIAQPTPLARDHETDRCQARRLRIRQPACLKRDGGTLRLRKRQAGGSPLGPSTKCRCQILRPHLRVHTTRTAKPLRNRTSPRGAGRTPLSHLSCKQQYSQCLPLNLQHLNHTMQQSEDSRPHLAEPDFRPFCNYDGTLQTGFRGNPDSCAQGSARSKKKLERIAGHLLHIVTEGVGAQRPAVFPCFIKMHCFVQKSVKTQRRTRFGRSTTTSQALRTPGASPRVSRPTASRTCARQYRGRSCRMTPPCEASTRQGPIARSHRRMP